MDRRIANRERRANRIMGCTWGEWMSLLWPVGALAMLKPPLMFGALALALNAGATLLVTRRLPPGALGDVLRHVGELLRYGARDFGPARTDVSLRWGDPIFPAARGASD
jgi:hypothetical protein